ncbi:hypothetical protein [Vibrio parahaemolyticus]|nr:hypothetical protein [Vibrio parahaemolyticus]
MKTRFKNIKVQMFGDLVLEIHADKYKHDQRFRRKAQTRQRVN